MFKYLITTLFLTVSFSAASDVEEFIQPKIDGVRLDWCLTPGADCGEPVAYKWCISNGYSKPILWEKDKDIGELTPTTMLNSRDTCYSNKCDGFNTIICYRKAR